MILNKGSLRSNLQRFLDCTAPVVPSQYLPKSEIRKLNMLWHPLMKDNIECFMLADLWDCYDEWSAYGAGVPIKLDNGETLIQYYVPYLSAIQIFTSNSSSNFSREESDSMCDMKDSLCDSLSAESEPEKLCRWDGSSSEEGGFDQDRSSHLNDRLGYLYVEYFERSVPYGRVPLMDKISELAQSYPRLLTLRSVDLSPASWFAVAWYPIYHIPMGRTIRDLATCFLTYHTLSSSFQDMNFEDETSNEKGSGISLPPFGLATYKMQGNIWLSTNSSRQDQERLVSLMNVADSWLKQLSVQHHDFNYFMGIRRG